ncbi:hypothetical protein EYF80_000590 [Liparis tanakae]|uniref:Uncharacterized protein n=1 Tax=Liparis tanakae TaxID=230148 RepID=A0A4Z2JJ89_9TELE|nr:hypothetical protein EYF80_000590 [Liparis tanakae]
MTRILRVQPGLCFSPASQPLGGGLIHASLRLEFIVRLSLLLSEVLLVSLDVNVSGGQSPAFRQQQHSSSVIAFLISLLPRE